MKDDKELDIKYLESLTYFQKYSRWKGKLTTLRCWVLINKKVAKQQQTKTWNDPYSAADSHSHYSELWPDHEWMR